MKINCKEIKREDGDWIYLADGRVQERAPIKTLKNFRFL